MCSGCQQIKLLEDFSISARGLYGRRSKCRNCLSVEKAQRYAATEKIVRRKAKDNRIALEVKTCMVCKIEKPKFEFYEAPVNEDGRKNTCIQCEKVLRHERYVANRAKVSKQVKERKGKNWSRWQDIRRRAVKRHQEKHPEIRKAHGVMAYEIKKGTQTKTPCEICGELKVEGHHPSYLPQDRKIVQYLCHVHHYRANRMSGDFKYYTKMLDHEWEDRVKGESRA